MHLDRVQSFVHCIVASLTVKTQKKYELCCITLYQTVQLTPYEQAFELLPESVPASRQSDGICLSKPWCSAVILEAPSLLIHKTALADPRYAFLLLRCNSPTHTKTPQHFQTNPAPNRCTAINQDQVLPSAGGEGWMKPTQDLASLWPRSRTQAAETSNPECCTHAYEQGYGNGDMDLPTQSPCPFHEVCLLHAAFCVAALLRDIVLQVGTDGWSKT